MWTGNYNITVFVRKLNNQVIFKIVGLLIGAEYVVYIQAAKPEIEIKLPDTNCLNPASRPESG